MSLLALALAAALGGAAPAEVVSAAPEAVTVTLYREGGLTSRDLQEDEDAAESGLVMVTETRTVELPAGSVRVAFRGVADGMIPQTASVAGLGAPVAEQNFDYDLLTPGALAARSVGETVRLVRTNPGTGKRTEERAIVRSAPQGVVLDLGGGRVEALDCSGLPEALVFERVPEGLASRPTLSTVVRSAAPGRRRITLSYLATGLAWSADYVARLRPDGRLDLTGWLTLANAGDTTFGSAPTRVVAGDLNREDVDRIEPRRVARESRCWPDPIRWNVYGEPMAPPPPPPPPPPPAAPMMAMARQADVQEIVVTGAKLARQSELGDYKLYTLPEATTVAAHQVKQVRFLEKRGVKVEQVYRADLDGQSQWYAGAPTPVDILLRSRNDAVSGLGEPLPAGNLVLMTPRERGGLFFAGEAEIEDAPVGLPLEFVTGQTREVAVAHTMSSETKGTGGVRRSYTAVVTNARREPATLDLRRRIGRDLTVAAEDVRHVIKDGYLQWTLTLAPGERRTFRYTTLTRD